jgi:DNA (cytosine-5)-methyltransferase 1
MKRGVKFEFPYNKEVFKDRYTRQHRDEPCSTIVAHLSKDGLMFIHPTQNRTLTPREAARVQSFPDWFEFPVSRTHQFRVIGNAVPPLVSEAIGLAVGAYMETSLKMAEITSLPHSVLPKDTNQALEWLISLVHAADHKSLRKVTASDFKRGWHSIGFLYPELHPCGALDHGVASYILTESRYEIRKIDHRLASPCYVRSGWPVALVPVGEEAWRRFETNELKINEFYCNEAVVAGMRQRHPKNLTRF